jgi:uncharacterized protein YbjT (DUF2867 family)
MTSRILVTGGTGTLGRHVVPRLRDSGCDVRVLSRHTHEAADGIEYVTGDLLKDEGIEAAVDGAGIVVHCAGSSKGDDDATRNLVRAASRAGAQHLVYISVIGVDRIPLVSVLPGSWNWRSTPRQGWRPTWPVLGSTAWPICSADICGLAASIG